MHKYVPEISIFLRISRSSLLTGVEGLKSVGSKSVASNATNY